MKLLRAQILHTPRSPFEEPDALAAFADGGLLVEGGRIVAAGDYEELRRLHPQAEVVDLRPGVLLPGFVDTHVHYPQVPVIGAMGFRLLDWLERKTLPEEARLADPARARDAARSFLASLLRNGTTTALVFGSHFAPAQEVFFEEAERSGLRITSGLVLSDRNLRPELHQTPEAAHETALELARRWHGRGRLRYAVTPRFALSASEPMLEACGALLRALPDLFFQTHLNETPEEVERVLTLFPWASDYLAVYERYGVVGERSVFAHDLHTDERQLDALAAARATVAHCPSSNAFLGSGLFPMRRHLDRGVRLALGSDVGGGTGFSLFKEGLMAYQVQKLRHDGFPLTPAHLLYLATRAGAVALGMAGQVGDFSPGCFADAVLVRPPAGSTLEVVLAHSASPQESLAALFTLAREESIARVYVEGEVLFSRGRGVPAASWA